MVRGMLFPEENSISKSLQQHSFNSPVMTHRESTEKELSDNDSETAIKKPRKVTVEPLNIVYEPGAKFSGSVTHESYSHGSFGS